MPVTVFANNPSTTTAGTDGTTSPASGTGETWGSTAWTQFQAASSSAFPPTQFHIADPAQPDELILVTNTATGAVTRGAEGTVPVAHAAGATFYQIVSAGDLTAMRQATGALTSAVNLASSTTETLICSYQPVAGEISPGTTFELMATGTIKVTAAPVFTWNLRWGWVSSGTPGTSLLSMVTATSCPALVSSMSVARSFEVNATVTFISLTSAIANINFFFQTTAIATLTGVVSSATPVTGLTTPPGGGPLALTAQWGTSSASNSLDVPGPVIFRAA